MKTQFHNLQKITCIFASKTLKTFLAIIAITAVSISCSKSDNPVQVQPQPTYEKEDFMAGFISSAGFDTRIADLDPTLTLYYGLVVKPNVTGTVSAFVLNAPKVMATGMVVTLWDAATSTALAEIDFSIPIGNKKIVKELPQPINLVKDKEYVISFKATNRWFYEKLTNVVYPIVSGNITILNNVRTNPLSTSAFPTVDLENDSFTGDCSFIFTRTE